MFTQNKDKEPFYLEDMSSYYKQSMIQLFCCPWSWSRTFLLYYKIIYFNKIHHLFSFI